MRLLLICTSQFIFTILQRFATVKQGGVVVHTRRWGHMLNPFFLAGFCWPASAGRGRRVNRAGGPLTPQTNSPLRIFLT